MDRHIHSNNKNNKETRSGDRASPEQGKKIITLMGATASGKSALAMNLAQRVGGVIINADAMQMYRDLRIITARPTGEEEERIPHRLYGVLDADEDSSVAVWLKMVVPEIRAAWEAGRPPILVGGTGMYIKALMEGLAEVPEIPAEARQRARELGKEALVRYDPLMDARLKPGDTQRRLRALEVMLATGKSLAEWQAEKTVPPLSEAVFDIYKIDRAREEIYARIDKRFAGMVEAGALEEVRALRNKLDRLKKGGLEADRAISPQFTGAVGISRSDRKKSGAPSTEQEARCAAHNIIHNLPILKSHGVPEILAHFAGETTLENAMLKAQQNTRNYAKRQMTWLRNQLPKAVSIVSADDILDRTR